MNAFYNLYTNLMFFFPPNSFASSSTDYTSVSGTGSPHTSGFSSSPMITPSRLPAVRTRTLKLPRRHKSKMGAVPRVYTIAELQIATNSFGEEHFIGEGSLGSVYKAHFPDGTVQP